MSYQFLTKTQSKSQKKKSKNKTPQTQPIPGRDMIQGGSGGWMFKADPWQILRRCLLIGTAQSTYYAEKEALSADFLDTLKASIQKDPNRVAAEIVYASDGHALNNSAPILALVLLSMGESPEAKHAFRQVFPQVIRTASHFYEWLSYTKGMRGFGKIVREVGRNWLSRENVKELAYQLLKYQQRQGFSHRDILRLFHVNPPTDAHNELFQWVLKGWETLPKEIPSEALAQIWWYEWVKRNPAQTHKGITQGHLTHEMVTHLGSMDPKAWELLFREMPVGALLRNLGSLTQLGVLAVDQKENLKRVSDLLTQPKVLRKARIHPIDILKALKTYQSGGQLGKSKKNWIPIPRIIDTLERALELSFEILEPTEKVFMHALDVSGSMSYYTVSSIGLTCCEIATAMVLATAKAEPHYLIRGFATDFRDLKITAKDSFRSALAKASSQNFGGTDASVAYQWMIQHHVKVDVICFWTDSESWAGKLHPSQALAEYRRKVNPKAKAIYVTLVPNQISLSDPEDPYSWDIAGFNPSAPRLIQMLAKGEI